MLNLAKEMNDHNEEVFLTEVWNDNEDFLNAALTARCENVLRHGEVQGRGLVEELRVKAQLHLVPREEVYATTWEPPDLLRQSRQGAGLR